MLRLLALSWTLLGLVACGARTPLEGYGPSGSPSGLTTGTPPSKTTQADGGGPASGMDAGEDASADTSRGADDTGADSGPAVDPSSLPPYAAAQCFGRVTATPNVTCTPSGGPSGSACNATLDCEGHEFYMQCADGVCTCMNPDFGETCYCVPPPDGTCTPAANCCWN
jgi:hypothetical protein